MNTKTQYGDKLLDPRWQKRRLEIFEHCEWTCQCCGSKDNTLHVHHFAYTSADPWDEPFTNLTTLCDRCHKIEHSFRNLAEDIIVDSLRNLHFLALDILQLSEPIAHFETRVMQRAQERLARLRAKQERLMARPEIAAITAKQQPLLDRLRSTTLSLEDVQTLQREIQTLQEEKNLLILKATNEP